MESVATVRNGDEHLDAMEEALEKGCRDADVIRAVARAKMGAMSDAEVEDLVKDAVSKGWKEAFGLKWCMKHVKVTDLEGNVMTGVLIDGIQHGYSYPIWTSSLSEYPSDVARQLVCTARLKLDPEVPKYVKYVMQGRVVPDIEMNYYVRTRAHIRVCADSSIRFPEYSVARKATASLTDDQFESLGATLMEMFTFYFAEHDLNMARADKAQVDALFDKCMNSGWWDGEEDNGRAIIKAWCEDLRPLCVV